jgi:AcrR family transcriptional regulator
MPDDEIVDELYAAQDPESPGRLLEATMRAGMARIRGMTMSRLAREAKVSRGTFYLWFTNQQTPSSWTLERVGKILNIPIRDLWDAYQGREQTPTSTEDAIIRLIGRLDRNDERMTALLARLEALANNAIVAGVTRALSEPPESPDKLPARPPRRKRPRSE